MAFLEPGYVRWDGTKFVTDPTVEIVGPVGPAGPTGAMGPTGPAGGGGGGGLNQLTGDVSAGPGTGSQTATVVRINGTTVPAGGSLTTGQVLRVTGSSNAAYGALDLANSSAITGILPTGNQAAQTMGGDISGTTASASVTDITGSGGFVDISSVGNIIRWAAATTAPGIMQTTGSGAGANLSISAQSAGGSNQNGGAIFLNGGAKTGSGFDGGIVNIGAFIGLAPIGSSTLTSYLLSDITSPGLFFSTDNTADVRIQLNSPVASGSGKNLKIRGQDGAAGNNNGGDIRINPGGKTGSGVDGKIQMLAADTTTVIAEVGSTYLSLGTTPATTGILRMPNNQFVYGRNVTNTTDFLLLGVDNSNYWTVGNTTCGLQLQLGGNDVILSAGATQIVRSSSSAWTQGPPISFTNATSNPYIKHADKTTNSGTGDTFTIQAQNETGTTSIGGILQLKSGTGTSRSGATQITCGSSIYFEVTEVVAGQRVVSLCKSSALTSTEMPAGTGDAVVFVANAATDPSVGTNPSGGGILFASSGAGKWRGSSGTTTTFGPAEPHCPTCGRDFAHEWQNAHSGEHLAICVPCMLTEMEQVGLNTRSFVFIREGGI